MAGAFYVALVVACFGFTSLFLDRDVISDPDAGPLLGPVAVGLVTVIVFVAVMRAPRDRIDTGRALLVGALAYPLQLLWMMLGYGARNDGAADGMLFASGLLASPFTIAAAALAAATILAANSIVVLSAGRDDPREHRVP